MTARNSVFDEDAVHHDFGQLPTMEIFELMSMMMMIIVAANLPLLQQDKN